jgi:anti-anti-sigma factor
MRTYPSALRPDVSVVLPEGRLDAEAAPALDQAISALEALGAQRVIVNLSSCTYISSSGLRALISHARRLRQVGGDLKLCCPSPRVMHVLDIAGLDAVLNISSSEADASGAFSSLASSSSGGRSTASAAPSPDLASRKA